MPGPTTSYRCLIPGRGVPAFTVYSSMGECRQLVNLKLRDGFTGGVPPSPGQRGCGGAIFHDKQKLLETK